MKFDPKQANTLIKKGEYDIEFSVVEQTKSKAGADMWKLTLKVWPGGGQRTMFDYIVFPNGLWKLKQIAAATDQQAKFDSGEMEPGDIQGQSARATVDVKEDAKYGDKNIIVRYLPQAAGAHGTRQPSSHNENGAPIDDEIPF